MFRESNAAGESPEETTTNIQNSEATITPENTSEKITEPDKATNEERTAALEDAEAAAGHISSRLEQIKNATPDKQLESLNKLFSEGDNLFKATKKGAWVGITAEEILAEQGLGAAALATEKLPDSIDRSKLYKETLKAAQEDAIQAEALGQLDHAAFITEIANTEGSGGVNKALSLLPEGSLDVRSVQSLIEAGFSEQLTTQVEKINNEAQQGISELLKQQPPSAQIDIHHRTGDEAAAVALEKAYVEQAITQTDADLLKEVLEKSTTKYDFDTLGAITEKLGIETSIELLEHFDLISMSKEERQWFEQKAEEADAAEKLENNPTYIQIVNINQAAAKESTPINQEPKKKPESVAKQIARTLVKMAVKTVKAVAKLTFNALKGTVKAVASLIPR